MIEPQHNRAGFTSTNPKHKEINSNPIINNDGEDTVSSSRADSFSVHSPKERISPLLFKPMINMWPFDQKVAESIHS